MTLANEVALIWMGCETGDAPFQRAGLGKNILELGAKYIWKENRCDNNSFQNV